jgi:Flp pilus assembly pilin Flp
MLSPELGGEYEAARVHHASRRCGGDVAPLMARAGERRSVTPSASAVLRLSTNSTLGRRLYGSGFMPNQIEEKPLRTHFSINALFSSNRFVRSAREGASTSQAGGNLFSPGGSPVKDLDLLRKLSTRFRNAEAGTTATEYSLIAAVVGLAVFVAVKLLGPSLSAMFANGVAADGRYTVDHDFIKRVKE